MTCARCEDLEEQVAYWKSEAGAVFEETLYARLRKRHGLTKAECRILTILSNGRVVPRLSLAELCGLASLDSLDVLVSRVRKRMGFGVIDTIYGRGYSIGSIGTEAINAVNGLAA